MVLPLSHSLTLYRHAPTRSGCPGLPLRPARGRQYGPVSGRTQLQQLESNWVCYYLSELDALCEEPRFVRSVLTSHLDPDGDAGIYARNDALTIIYLRYGRDLPSWLWDDQLDRHGFIGRPC